MLLWRAQMNKRLDTANKIEQHSRSNSTTLDLKPDTKCALIKCARISHPSDIERIIIHNLLSNNPVHLYRAGMTEGEADGARAILILNSGRLLIPEAEQCKESRHWARAPRGRRFAATTSESQPTNIRKNSPISETSDRPQTDFRLQLRLDSLAR
jgi:hypothetical protein